MSRAPDNGVLLLGATGRTGHCVLTQLLERRVRVHAIVRSADRLPVATLADPLLTVTTGELTAIPAGELRQHVSACNVMISCLGHPTNVRGVFGPPRDLVERAVIAVCDAAASLGPEKRIRLILMSSVSVNRPERADKRRGAVERAFVGLMRTLLPPAQDNQRAAAFLASQIGAGHPSVSWVVVRPDTLTEGETSDFETHEGVVTSLFRPATTRISNVARFMADLVTDAATWRRWRGRMPVIVDARG